MRTRFSKATRLCRSGSSEARPTEAINSPDTSSAFHQAADFATYPPGSVTKGMAPPGSVLRATGRLTTATSPGNPSFFKPVTATQLTLRLLSAAFGRFTVLVHRYAFGAYVTGDVSASL